jgi:hypothetical protein
MISTHPHVGGQINEPLVQAAEAAFDCAQICGSCADACLGEPMVAELVQCIRLNLDCSDVCLTTGLVSTRRSGGDVPVIRAQLTACEMACARCAEECEHHAQRMEHCRICAETCRACERACRAAIDTLPETAGSRMTPH